MLECRRGWWWALALVVLTALPARPARALVLKVGPGERYTKIQDAIQDAVEGVDTVEVAAGTYPEAVDFLGKKVRVSSVGGPAATVINATGLARTPVVTFKTGETSESILEGFTLTGGSGAPTTGTFTGGGGIFIDKSAPTVRNCEIKNNTATKGGGVYFQGVVAGALLDGCIISGNKATSTTGPAGAGIASSFTGIDPSFVTIKDCQVIGNVAQATTAIQGGGAYLGGINNPQTRVVISGTVFKDNLVGTQTVSQGEGGGLTLDTIPVEIQGGEVSGNKALKGGGFSLKNQPASSLISGTVVKNNTAHPGGGGGGFYFPGTTNNSRLTLSGVEISENVAGLSGGGGMWVEVGAPVIDSCRFIGNTTQESGGAIRYISSGIKTRVNATLFLKNKASNQGGAVYISSSSSTAVVYTNCAFVQNQSTAGGGAVYDKAPSLAAIAKFIFCTFYGNTAGAGQVGGLQFDAAAVAGQVQVSNCILWANTPSDYAADATSAAKISFCDVKVPPSFPPTRPGMLSKDPEFVDQLADPPDLHLKETSPLLDAGDTKVDVDWPGKDHDGKDRVADGPDADETPAPDMGAFEIVLRPVIKPKFVRGLCRHPDANLEGARVNIGDAIYLLRWRFSGLGYPTPGCEKACDADDSGAVDLTDAVQILQYLFIPGRPAPRPPFPTLDEDPTFDTLGCVKGRIDG